MIASTLPGTFVAVLLNSLFWFCGVNGGQVVGAVMNPLWIQYADANRIAQAAGEVLPNIVTAPLWICLCILEGAVRQSVWHFA